MCKIMCTPVHMREHVSPKAKDRKAERTRLSRYQDHPQKTMHLPRYMLSLLDEHQSNGTSQLLTCRQPPPPCPSHPQPPSLSGRLVSRLASSLPLRGNRLYRLFCWQDDEVSLWTAEGLALEAGLGPLGADDLGTVLLLVSETKNEGQVAAVSPFGLGEDNVARVDVDVDQLGSFLLVIVSVVLKNDHSGLSLTAQSVASSPWSPMNVIETGSVPAIEGKMGSRLYFI